MLAGKYRLQQLLARGGMGLVYAARHETTGRELAIKLLRPELAGRADLVRRVSAEARLAVEAAHPNVVEVLDAGADEHDIPYLVLERLYGHPLDELLDEPLSLVAAAQALMPIINALAALHRAGIVHRDIKPSNIFLSREEDGRVRPKLLDFGIAKALESAGATLSGVAVGTPAYMAPEQALGCAVGPATDVWSMGVVLARCLTGRLPFEGAATRGLGSLLSGPRPEDLQHVPDPVALVLVGALQLEPARRPASMEGFRQELLSALQSAAPRQVWPNQASVNYAPESELARLLMDRRGTANSAAGEGREEARVQARARHVLTRTLSKVRQTGSRLRSRRSVVRGSFALLFSVAGTWALHGSTRQAGKPLAAGQQPSATARSAELLQPARELPSLAVSASTSAPSAAAPFPARLRPAGLSAPSAMVAAAADVAAQGGRQASGVPAPRSPQPMSPATLHDRALRQAAALRAEPVATSAAAPPKYQLPPQQSAALAAPSPVMGANRSPIIE